MPRKPRFYLPFFPVHIIQRGNDRRAVFFTDDDYPAYLAISRMIQHVGRNYVTYINRRYRRSGTLWEGKLDKGY